MAQYYDLNMNNQRIYNCLDPAAAQDVATRNYVDTHPGSNRGSPFTVFGNPANNYFFGIPGTALGTPPPGISTPTNLNLVGSDSQPFTLSPGVYLITHVLEAVTTISTNINNYFQFGGFRFSVTYNSTVPVTSIEGGMCTSFFPVSNPNIYDNQPAPPSGAYNIFDGILTFNFTQCIYISSNISAITLNITPGTVGSPSNPGTIYFGAMILHITNLSGLYPLTYLNATGGTETQYSVGNITYKVHTFTSSGTFMVNSLSNSEQLNNITYLLVAGGGSIGNDSYSIWNGGGGGGGVVINYNRILPITGAYAVVVGLGGANGSNGQNSSLANPNLNVYDTVIGGGAGGSGSVNGNNGGSGGGGGGGGSGSSGGSPSGQQGYAGGNGDSVVGGGGGGWTEPGVLVSAGNGGSVDMTGTPIFYSAGGGPLSGVNGSGWAADGYGHGGSNVDNNPPIPANHAGRPGIVVIRYRIS